MMWFLFWLFTAIQFADVWTTWRGFQLGGEEAMPLARLLFSRIGFWPTVLLIKGVGIAAALASTLLVSNAYWFTGSLCAIGLYVIWRNWKFIRAASGPY